jgi:Flp pilus assembly pilin Flp
MANERVHVSRASRRHEGQTMAEYSVVLGVITIAIVTAIALLSSRVDRLISAIAGLM